MKWIVLMILFGLTFHYNPDGSIAGHSYDNGRGMIFNYDASGGLHGYDYYGN